MPRRDPHSYNDDTQVETESWTWVAKVDFASRTLACEVELTFRKPGGGALDLDTRELAIESVEVAGTAVPWTMHPAEPILGSRLTIELPANAGSVRIRYRTSPSASALQWLDPAQTSGGAQPFLFSQCQAIHARSVVPCQDTPRLRVRYVAELAIPAQLHAVMAAAPVSRTVDGEIAASTTAIVRYEMPQPIPPYLFAFAVGDLASKDLSPRSRVWAEPAVLEKAAWEFGTVEDMIVAAEALFGPYDWDRFDMLTMPPSFPYGGMENPRLTFLTPSLIAGDRSLVRVLAHELAHSWTGNLVTNANAEHFWLNEGFTVYAERRIIEAIYGVEIAKLEKALGRRVLDDAIARFAQRPEMTKLRTSLWNVDPDDTYSQVPYQKGYFFLALLEDTVGRAAFDAWLRSYLDAFRFGAITTDDFVAHFEQAFPGVIAKAGDWIDGVGLPANAPAATSTRLDAIVALRGGMPPAALATTWNATEWLLYLESVPKPSPICAELDAAYRLTQSTNYEILVAWLELAVKSNYLDVLPRVQQVLAAIGRMKFLRPLYLALAKHDRTLARSTFDKLRSTYHPIAQQMVESVLRDVS